MYHLPTVIPVLKPQSWKTWPKRTCAWSTIKLHQWVCCNGFPMVFLTLSGGRSLSYNTVLLELATHSEPSHRDPYTDCAPMLWSPMNFGTWCYHKHFMTICTSELVCIRGAVLLSILVWTGVHMLQACTVLTLSNTQEHYDARSRQEMSSQMQLRTHMDTIILIQ